MPIGNRSVLGGNTLLLFSDYQNVTVWGPNMGTITSPDAPPEPSS